MGGRGWRTHLAPIPPFESSKMLSKTFPKSPSIDSESFVSFEYKMRGGWPDQLRGEDIRYLPLGLQTC